MSFSCEVIQIHVDEIINLLKEGDHHIEIAYDDKVKDDAVVYGHVTKNGTNGGMDRREFSFRHSDDINRLLKESLDYLQPNK